MAGLETSTTLSDTEYRDLLTEYKTLKDDPVMSTIKVNNIQNTSDPTDWW